MATQLRRQIGLPEAVALGVGGTVGGGVFVLIGAAASEAGPAALAAFVLAFAAALLIALPYAELACRYPLAGAGYAFARAALGPAVGFGVGWGYWGAYLLISGYVTLGFGGYLHVLLGVPPEAGAGGLILACVVVNVLGMRVSGRVQLGVVTTAVLGLVAFSAWGAPTVDLHRLTPFAPHGLASVPGAALLAFLAFGGFDMVAAAGEEVRSPERTLPRAILLTLAIVLGLYLAVSFVALGVLDWHRLGTSHAPLADAATRFGGTPASVIVFGAAALSTAATANAVLVITSRIAFAMARDGLLPRGLDRIGGRTGAPWAAVVVNGALLALVGSTGSIRLTALAGGFLYVVHFLAALCALLVLRRRGIGDPAFRTPLASITILLAVVACLVLLAASGVSGAITAVGWLSVGIPIGVLVRWRSRESSRSRPAPSPRARARPTEGAGR